MEADHGSSSNPLFAERWSWNSSSSNHNNDEYQQQSQRQQRRNHNWPQPPSQPPPAIDDHSLHEAFDRARIEVAKKREMIKKLPLSTTEQQHRHHRIIQPTIEAMEAAKVAPKQGLFSGTKLRSYLRKPMS